MIKLIIFDVDGVLVSTKELHYMCLNKAIKNIAGEKYCITEEEHHSIYDGLSTREKLNLLSNHKKLSHVLHNSIYSMKQELTDIELHNFIKPDLRLEELFGKLKSQGYRIALASNCIAKSVNTIIKKLKITSFDAISSNNDVLKPKPHPEMYLKLILHFSVMPCETLIVEDSPNGVEAAVHSGAQVCVVKEPNEVTLEKLQSYLNMPEKKFKWPQKDINILIPIAGDGKRFKDVVGYVKPKPLIDVNGIPMIQRVIDNLNVDGHYIFVVRSEHCIESFLRTLVPECKIIVLNSVTQGAACTTLLATDYINNDTPLMIANGDQLVNWDVGRFIYSTFEKNADGGILTFNANHPKWSYVAVNSMGNVTNVAEKRPISNIATVGIYLYKKGKDYVHYAKQMIKNNIRTNNEFYVAPVYNEFIADGRKIVTYPCKEMWGIGDPDSLQYYLNNHK